MKNKILSVGIAFAFLLMAACSHKGGEIASLNIPPGSDIAKAPGQQTPSVQTAPGTPDQSTGPTTSNLPPPSTPDGESEPVNIIGQLPPPPTISGTGSGTPQPFPGRGPTLGGGITGGTGTNPPAATEPAITAVKIETKDAQDNVLNTYPVDITQTPIPAVSIPAGFAKIVLTITPNDPGTPSFTYALKINSVEMGQNNNGVFALDINQNSFVTGNTYSFKLSVTDSETSSWHPDYNIPVTIVSAGASPGTSGGTNGGAVSPGTLDLQFNGNGKLLVNGTENFINTAKSIIVQNNGAKFVVAGTQKLVGATDSQGILLRYFDNGSLDTSFGTNGKTILTGFTSIKDIAAQADGKIIVVGDRCDSPPIICSVRVKQLSANGIINFSFDRIISYYRYPRSLHVEAVKILSNGKILLVGEEEETVNNPRSNIVLWRLNADGAFDGTFVSPNYPSGVVVEIGISDTKASELLLQEDKIIVAGSIRDNLTSKWKPLLWRLQEDGTLDTTFGGSNTGYVTLSSYPSQDAYFTDIVAQPDGKLVAVGTIEPRSSFYGTSQKIVKRFDPNGSQEQNFGGSSDYVIVDSNSNLATSVALKADGSILIGGSQCSPTWYFWRWSCDFMLQQLTASGIADGTFGPDHTSSVITDMESGNDGIGALTVLPNGKILAVGVGGSQTAGQTVLAIGKYNP